MVRLWLWSLTGKLGRERGRKAWHRWGGGGGSRPPGLPLPRLQPLPHLEQVPHSLGEAHSVHGHAHSVGESKNEADGAAELWAETPGDEEVGATCGGQSQEP